jgi:hypothetical protein
MIRNRILLKSIAVFLILETLVSTVAPTISWALTAGPTAPEFSSFEPVDTTDAVNLATGDLTYNIPLLEVPGPSGGYPLSLSYHAGIQTNLDASWVGLGFTLNPGAINRSVSGYADDFANSTGSSRAFWAGGSNETYTVGINTGYGGMTGVSAGLTFSEDTYKGFGVGHYFEASAGASFGPASLKAGISVGSNGYGQSYNSTGISGQIMASTNKSMGLVSGSASAGWGFSINSSNGGAAKISGGMMHDYNISASYAWRGTGASISAGRDGIKSSGSLAGGATVTKQAHNSKSGKISTSGYNYIANIPTPWGFSVRLGKSYQRYWIDETENVLTNGALYFPTTGLPSSSQLNTRAYDVYDLADTGQPFSKSVPDESLAGSFADYDSYQVLAQGVSGTMRPFHFQSYLLRQNKKVGEEYRVKSYPLHSNKKPAFRFVGDFSNRYLHDMKEDAFYSSTTSDPPLRFEFDSNRVTGENGTDGYDVDENKLQGSRKIEWFTNEEVFDNERDDDQGNQVPTTPTSAVNRGFIDCKALGFLREDNKQAGGFMITNESGVTYHYALPVYSFDEHTYSGRVDYKNSHQFNTYRKSERYAYTWLLTAVTGPDFVDRNENGYADAQDWGYWVTFEYGKWSNAYNWRNPAEGFNKDIDQAFNNFSKGKKQLYYLNAIRTKSHTALFVKELRFDGKSVVPEMSEAVLTGGEHTVENIDEGGFDKKTKTDFNGNQYVEYPTSTLRLHSIYLLQNKDFDSDALVADLPSVGNVYFHAPTYGAPGGKYTHGKNVLDVHDIENEPLKTDLKNKSIKKIDFNTDYSLCPATDNSYISEMDVLNTDLTPSEAQLGKLTLKSVKFWGKGEADLVPEMKFKYGDEEKFYATVSGSDATRTLKVDNFQAMNFKVGEIVRLIHLNNSRTAYAYIFEINQNTEELEVRFFSGREIIFNTSGVYKFEKTKNPPFDSEKYDLWGFYKSDFINSPILSENEKRRVTSTSAESLDVWSLTEVTSSLGAKIKIEYEADRYTNAIKTLSNIPIKDVELVDGGKTRIILSEKLSEYGLEKDQQINLRLMHAIRYEVENYVEFEELRFDCNGEDKVFTYNWITDNHYNQSLIPIESVRDRDFVIAYNYTNRFPIPDNSSDCLTEAYPYGATSSCQQGGIIPYEWLAGSVPIFLGGEVVTDRSISTYGGGLRVSKISVSQFNEASSTMYQYENGTTPYEPLGFEVPIRRLTSSEVYECLRTLENEKIAAYRDSYMQSVFKEFQFLFANSRELPGPGVLYELVTVREQIKKENQILDLPGKTEYQFEVFAPKTIDAQNTNHNNLVNQYRKQYALQTGTAVQLSPNFNRTVLDLFVSRVEKSNNTIIEDFSAIMGSLKRITYYDKDNNKISETINNYLHDDFNVGAFKAELKDKYKNQGTITETFIDARLIINPNQTQTPKNYSMYGLVSHRVKYPSILTGQTTHNFKTGIKTTSHTTGFDFYSGQTVKSKSTDGYGNTYVSETIPAYRIYNGMRDANMLTQEASSYIYKVDALGGNIGLVSGAAQTWSDDLAALEPGETTQQATPQPNIWRKRSTYSFIGDNSSRENDGLWPISTFSPFDDWDENGITQGWQKNSEIMLYDVNSHALEVKDLNGHYSATKMSYDQTKVFASATNAQYNEFAYSGAEEVHDGFGMFGGRVNIAEGVRVNSETANSNVIHTGNWAVQLNSSGIETFEYILTATPENKGYHASVWVNSEGGRLRYTINGIAGASEGVPSGDRKAGSWYLLSIDSPPQPSGSVIKVWCATTGGATHFDDYRICPASAVMTSYVYNKWGELSHTLDNNNLYTEYVYDAMGRLSTIYTERLNKENDGLILGRYKISESEYHYANQE